MPHTEDFILTLIEMTAMIFLWDSLMKEKRDVKKYIFIIISTTIIVRLSDFFNLHIASIVSYGYLILLVAILFKKRIDEALMEFGIVTIISIALQIVIMGITYILKDYVSLFVRGIIINVSMLVTILSINQFAPIENVYHRHKSYIGKTYLFLANILFYILVVKFVRESNSEFFWNNIWYLTFITVAFVFFNVIFLINNIKYQEQKKQVETYNKYSPIMSNLMEDIKRRQHDFKNHVNTIFGIIQVTDEKVLKIKLEDYIGSLVNSMRDYDYIIKVENHIIGAIIYNKVCEAQDKEVKFTYEVENGVCFRIKEFELSEIINNLLDNAFEAAEKNELNNKLVTLKVYREEENNIIEVKNTYMDEKIKLSYKFFKRGFSTKEEQGHGYGLYNIKKIVESYNGNIQLYIHDDLIVLQILLK